MFLSYIFFFLLVVEISAITQCIPLATRCYGGVEAVRYCVRLLILRTAVVAWVVRQRELKMKQDACIYLFVFLVCVYMCQLGVEGVTELCSFSGPSGLVGAPYRRSLMVGEFWKHERTLVGFCDRDMFTLTDR